VSVDVSVIEKTNVFGSPSFADVCVVVNAITGAVFDGDGDVTRRVKLASVVAYVPQPEVQASETLTVIA
jgi:hypothetical protein